MAKKANSLAHTKWMCKYHIVFTPKYRRKVIYNQLREDIGEILRTLCRYKGVEIIEGHLMSDHVHMLVMIPPKISFQHLMNLQVTKFLLSVIYRIILVDIKIYVMNGIINVNEARVQILLMILFLR